MQQYIKLVEAVKLTDENIESVVTWMNGLGELRKDFKGRYILVSIIENFGTAGIGQWIVRERDGHFQIVSDVDFKKRYDPSPAKAEREGQWNEIEKEVTNLYSMLKLPNAESNAHIRIQIWKDKIKSTTQPVKEVEPDDSLFKINDYARQQGITDEVLKILHKKAAVWNKDIYPHMLKGLLNGWCMGYRSGKESAPVKEAGQPAPSGLRWQPIEELTTDYNLHKVVLRYDNSEIRRYFESDQPFGRAIEFAYLSDSPAPVQVDPRHVIEWLQNNIVAFLNEYNTDELLEKYTQSLQNKP